MPQMADRELRGAEPEHGLAGKVLELAERALHVRLEGGRLHAKDQLVAVGVASDLVAAVRHLPHELGVRLCDVAEHKKRRTNIHFVQHIEQAMGRTYYGRRRTNHLPGELPVNQLMPIFQIDRQRVNGHSLLPAIMGTAALTRPPEGISSRLVRPSRNHFSSYKTRSRIAVSIAGSAMLADSTNPRDPSLGRSPDRERRLLVWGVAPVHQVSCSVSEANFTATPARMKKKMVEGGMYQCHSSAEETRYTITAPVSPPSKTFCSPPARHAARARYPARRAAKPVRARKATMPVSVPCSR